MNHDMISTNNSKEQKKKKKSITYRHKYAFVLD